MLLKYFVVPRRLLAQPAGLHRHISNLVNAYTRTTNLPVQAALFTALKGGRRKYSTDDKKPDGKELVVESEDGEFEDIEGASDSPNIEEKGMVKATVPENYPDIIAVPVSRRPVFPGFYKTISIKDTNVANALSQALKKGKPYVGLFLATKDEDHSVPGEQSEGKSEDVISNLNEIHKTGVFAQVINIIPMPSDGMTAIVYPHRRIRATELLSSSDASVSQVRSENIKDESYDRKDRTIRAISQEIFAVLADVAKLNAFFREHITHHNVPASVFEDPSRLADFVAVLSSSDASELQALLEETQVEERLRKALLLLKKELITAQLQHSISKDVEQKLTQKQREYFLHEQLKTIKKELGLETDSKEKLIQTFTERAGKLTMPESVKKVFDEVKIVF